MLMILFRIRHNSLAIWDKWALFPYICVCYCSLCCTTHITYHVCIYHIVETHIATSHKGNAAGCLVYSIANIIYLVSIPTIMLGISIDAHPLSHFIQPPDNAGYRMYRLVRIHIHTTYPSCSRFPATYQPTSPGTR
jgi:hypothetical protein